MSQLHLKNYKSHESVRERNKREQRRFDLTSNGRYNEFKFKLNGISKEQKQVEKELEKIRSGVHRPPNSALAASQKAFNASNVRFLGENNFRVKTEKSSPKRSPRPNCNSEQVEIDTGMLVEYLQKLQDANVIDIDTIIPDQNDNNSTSANQSMTPDPKRSQSSAQNAERSGSINHKQLNLPTINDKYIESRGSSDKKGDLINTDKSPSPEQRHLKSSPVAAMSSLGTGGVLEKEHSSSQKQSNESEFSKGDVLSRRKSIPQTQSDYNDMRYHYDPNGYFGPQRTQLNSDKQWEQARAARYVRTREPLERDRELSVKEIFDQSKQ